MSRSSNAVARVRLRSRVTSVNAELIPSWTASRRWVSSPAERLTPRAANVKANSVVSTRATVARPSLSGAAGPLRRPLRQRRPLGPDRLVVQEPPQVVGQLPGRGVALGRVLRQRLERRSSPAPPGSPGPASAAARGSSKAICRSSSCRSVAVDGRPQRQQLVQRRPQASRRRCGGRPGRAGPAPAPGSCSAACRAGRRSSSGRRRRRTGPGRSR